MSAAATTTHPSPSLSACSSSVVFGPADWRAQALVFRATISIACPLGVAFSATLSSPGGCELQSSSGERLRYELFADPQMRSAVVSCEGATSPLNGSGRQTFIAYGRVAGPVRGIGQFHDALVTSLAP
jgi:hypothetical protein